MYKYFILISTLLFSCKAKYDNVISQEKVDQNTKVTIKKDYKNLDQTKILISFPLKFKVTKDSNVKDRIFLIKNDNQLLHQVTDYMFYDENYKSIYDIEKKSSMNKDLVTNLIVFDVAILKSKLNKRNANLINNMDIRDTIAEDYNDFKRQNPLVFKELNKIGDTIILRSFSKDKLLSEKRIKINW